MPQIEVHVPRPGALTGRSNPDTIGEGAKERRLLLPPASKSIIRENLLVQKNIVAVLLTARSELSSSGAPPCGSHIKDRIALLHRTPASSTIFLTHLEGIR